MAQRRPINLYRWRRCRACGGLWVDRRSCAFPACKMATRKLNDAERAAAWLTGVHVVEVMPL